MVFFLTCIHLQSIFDWNVKQLFLYLSAEYSTKNNVSMKKKFEAITHFSTAAIFKDYVVLLRRVKATTISCQPGLFLLAFMIIFLTVQLQVGKFTVMKPTLKYAQQNGRERTHALCCSILAIVYCKRVFSPFLFVLLFF